METRLTDPPRHVIPRWRPASVTIRLGELSSVAVGQRIRLTGDLTQLVDDWRSHRSPAFAADLVGAALVVGDLEAGTEAAEFLIARSENVPAAAIALARTLLSRPDTPP